MTSRFRKAVFGLPLAGAVLLTGCSQAPSDYARVNGVSIPTSAVNNVVDGCSAAAVAATGQSLDAGQLRPLVAGWLIAGEMADQIGQQANFQVSATEQSDHLRGTPQLQGLRTNPDCEQALLGLSKYDLTGLALQSTDSWGKYFNDLRIDVNPRFGVWDMKQMGVVAVPGQLATPFQR